MSLETLDREIIKIEQRIEEYKEKVRRLKERKQQEEDAKIIKLVRSANLSIAELQKMFSPAEPIKIKEDEEDV